MASAQWILPSSNGGLPILGLTLTIDDGVHAPTQVALAAGATTYALGDVASGTVVSVVAYNAEGSSVPAVMVTA
jgi:hypothetical protein